MKKTLFGQEFILEDISELGVQDLAFLPEEADRYIEHLKNEKILILGGDILFVDNGKAKFSYDNWYSESTDYLETYQVAKKYFELCKKRYANRKYLIVVVAKGQHNN